MAEKISSMTGRKRKKNIKHKQPDSAFEERLLLGAWEIGLEQTQRGKKRPSKSRRGRGPSS